MRTRRVIIRMECNRLSDGSRLLVDTTEILSDDLGSIAASVTDSATTDCLPKVDEHLEAKVLQIAAKHLDDLAKSDAKVARRKSTVRKSQIPITKLSRKSKGRSAKVKRWLKLAKKKLADYAIIVVIREGIDKWIGASAAGQIPTGP